MVFPPDSSALSWGRGRGGWGGEVRQYAQLREHGGHPDTAVGLLDLAVAHVPDGCRARPRRLDHPGGRLGRPEEGPPDRQLDRGDVPEHVDPVQFPVTAGKELAHKDDHIAQMLTPVALRARPTADAGEHAILGEQAGEPPGVQDSTLRKVVRAAHERFGSGVIMIPIWVSTRTCPGSALGRLEVATGFR